MNKKAVCLISGGLDSCVTSYIARQEGFDIFALTFFYGQRHKKEINCSKKIATSVKVKNHIFFNLDINKFKGSSLTDESLLPEKDNVLEEIGKKIPSTYVPARNTIFLSIALAYAESIDADSIYIGVTSSDYSGYPDCRPEFIESFQKMADIATKRTIQGKKIKIKAPLLNLNKSEIIKKGLLLKVPFEKTWSCYYGKNKACGRCDSCLLRLKGFKEAKIKDPLEYFSFPDWY
jgi:7-cyano-7-deazaguanine synthase